MERELEELLDKYWKGETTVDEERRVKAHFAKAKDISPTGQYFKSIHQQQQVKSEVSWKKKSNYTRFSAAATIVIGLLVAFLTLENNRKNTQFVVEDPREAYEITRNALMMISGGLNEGKQYSEELKKINKPKTKDEDS